MENEIIKLIENQIDYKFKNVDLLDQAFTHKTFAGENNCASNQVLEFLGDEVLDFYVTKMLIDRLGYLKSNEKFIGPEDFDEFLTLKNVNESDLTEIKKALVDNKMLAHRIEAMGDLQNYLYLGVGASKQNVQKELKTKADLFEAILGAIAIDSNWNSESLENTVRFMLNIDYSLKYGFNKETDYLQLLQTWYQKLTGKVPEFDYVEYYRGMPIFNNDKFCAKLRLDLQDYRYLNFDAYGQTKAEARYNCAKKAYKYLEENGYLSKIEDDCPKEEDLTIDNSINVLQELAQKEWISMPEYIIPNKEVYDEEGNSRWECTCIIESENIERVVHATNKKLAKKYAAYLCICDLMGYKDKYDGKISF